MFQSRNDNRSSGLLGGNKFHGLPINDTELKHIPLSELLYNGMDFRFSCVGWKFYTYIRQEG